MNFRDLRLWHWRMVMHFRKRVVDLGNSQNMATIHAMNCEANFHLAAVQLLNDHVSGTAEADLRAEQEKAAP